MKYTAPLLALLAVANAAHFSKEQYESGEVHQRIIDMKNTQWDALEAAGALNSSQWPSWKDWDQLPKSVKKDRLQCKRGVAVAEKGNPNQTFRCKNMDLYDFLNHESMGGGEADPRYPNRRGSSVWGWVGPKGRQIALIGQHTGTAFIEVDKKGKLTYLGRLPAQDPLGSSWREIRVLNNLAIIGSEAVGHNVQIFDMNKVAAIDPSKPVTFDTTKDLDGLFDDLPIGRAHNVVIDWDNEYAIAVGAQPRNQTCAAGLEYINLDDSTNPYKPGCASSDGYTHDAQCVTYNGPDRRYKGRNICVAYNEDSITVWDSTNKADSKMLGRLEYPGATYTHQGQWTERNWHQFVLLNDELDEVEGVVADGVPITHIIDLTDLRNPKWTGTFQSTDGEKAVDHNLFITDGVMFQSNYGAGVWVKDVRSISKYPDGSRVKTLAMFDMHPEDDATNGSLDFVGSWGNFQFPSGFIVANTFERGAYSMRVASGRGRNGGKGFGGKSK